MHDCASVRQTIHTNTRWIVDVEQHIFIDLCAEDILASDPLACDWRASGKMSKIVFKRDRDSVNKWYLQLYIPCPRKV